MICLVVGLGGCSRLRPKPPATYVYVTVRQTFLRDRVAAVSNRTATVMNGERLQVLDHGRRFFRVQTEKGAVGWIDERTVATQQVADGFEALKQEHKNDAAVATAVVRDEVYLHVKPGRETDHFFLLSEGDKLKLLRRATLPKPVPGGARALKAGPIGPVAAGGKEGEVPAAPPVVMEDWWLVQDSQGDMGWLLSRMIDVDAPDSLTRYSEGQRIVGAYVLTTVNDPDADQADKNIPVYLTVLSPYKAGLPYDFDQVRVFTWNVKKHRYETAFRERNIEGYLPVEIKMAADPYGKSALAATPVPTFSYRVLAAEAPDVVPDPTTGAIVPGKTVLKTFRLEGNLVRRVLQPGMPAPMETHPVVEEKKAKVKVAGKKKRR
jgi:hypothetical protein